MLSLIPNYRRLAGTGGDGGVPEAEPIERILDRQRASEPYAAVDLDVLLPLQSDPNNFQEVLVPADRDAVFGNAAESCQDPVVQVIPKRLRVADRLAEPAS